MPPFPEPSGYEDGIGVKKGGLGWKKEVLGAGGALGAAILRCLPSVGSPRCREGDAVCPAWLCGVGEPRRSSRCRGFSSPFELVVGEEEQREFSVSSSRVARPQIPLPALLQPPALPPQLRGPPWPHHVLGKQPSSEALASCPAAEPSGGASPARGGSLGHVAPLGTWRARFWGHSVLAMLL